MTSDYMNMSPALLVMDHYLRQSIEVAGQYLEDFRRLRAIELLGLMDLSQFKYAYKDCAMCELSAARRLVGQAYAHHLIDAADFYTIDRMLVKCGINEKEVKS